MPNFNLTKTEREVAILICDGLTNVGIAHVLNMAVRTVERHVGSIFEKMIPESYVIFNRRVLLTIRMLSEPEFQRDYKVWKS